MQNWYIKFPTYQYNENVKQLAKDNRLKIIDDVYQGDNKQCDNPPKLTVIGEVIEQQEKPTKKK